MFLTILIKGGTHSNNVLRFSALPPFWDGLHRQQKEGMRSYHAFFLTLLSSISLPFECISRNWIINANININMQLNICFIKHNISWIATLPIEGQKLPFLPFFFLPWKMRRMYFNMPSYQNSEGAVTIWKYLSKANPQCLPDLDSLLLFLKDV